METADLVAASFWPCIAFLAIARWMSRGNTSATIVLLTVGAGVMSAALLLRVIYGQVSLFVLIDEWIAYMVVGGLLIAWGRGFGPRPIRDMLSPEQRIVAVLLGAAFVLVNAAVLWYDLAVPHLVVEGRVTEVRVLHGRNTTTYEAEIAPHRFLKTTLPDYERLKLRPYVRAEVGQGSHDAYRIDYLAN